MPDLLTHTSVGFLLKKPFRFKLIFLVGTVLPDVVARIPYFLIGDTGFYLIPFHTPVGLLVFGYFLSLFFEEKERRDTFIAITAGMELHLFMDMLQRLFEPTYLPLFPFSFIRFQLGLMWSDDFLYLLPVLILLIAILWKKL